jgi:radical SAM protein with 4Fe4S-binding SPASM domain
MAEQGYSVKRNLNQQPLWQTKVPLLNRLDIELTERCNNACLHCYINLPENDSQARSRELNTEEWKGILRQAAELGALSVRFTGGEPLLREDFAELYLCARRLGMKVLLFTNGRLITPELAELFARIPPLEKIEITVYGMHPETYDEAACAPGGYAEVRRGIELLLERQAPFIVKGALMPQNQAETEEFEAWAATIPWMDEPPGYAMFFELRSRRDSAGRDRLIQRLRISPEAGVTMLTRWPEKYRKEMGEFCSRFMGASGERLFDCGAGLGGCVDAYGCYQPCMLLRDPVLSYDLRSGSLQDALENFFPQALKIKATNPEYLERCGRCFLHGLCEQCPGKSWSEYGTLDTPVEYLCQVAHAQARYLGLLQPGEKAWEIEDWKERLNILERINDANKD